MATPEDTNDPNHTAYTTPEMSMIPGIKKDVATEPSLEIDNTIANANDSCLSLLVHVNNNFFPVSTM